MRIQRTLRTTIVCITGVPLLLAALLFLYYSYQDTESRAIHSLTTVLQERTIRQAAELNLFFGTISRHADALASLLSATGSIDSEAGYRMLHSVLDVKGISAATIAYDTDAFLAKGAPPALLLRITENGHEETLFSKSAYYDYTHVDWFLLPKLASKGIWTDPFLSPIQKEMVISYAAPIVHEGVFQGVVALTVFVDEIIKNLQSINMEGSQLILLSQFGTVVVHPNRDFILRHTLISLAHERSSPQLTDFAYQQRVMPENGIERFEVGILGNDEYIAHAQISFTGWTLLSVIPERVAVAPVKRSLWTNVFFISVSALMVFLVGYYFSTREIVTPLLRLEKAAEHIASGKLDVQIPETSGIKEMSSVERAFNSMAAQLGDSLEKEISAGRARSYAEEASKAKSDFVARMSHEIRTPMNAILGLTHLALDEKPAPRQEEYLQKIRRAGKGMLSLINDILDFSKIEAGMLQLEHTPFQITELSHTVDDLFSAVAHEKGLNFKIHVDERLPSWLVGDPLRITQILMNLCNNALKFTEKGCIVINMSAASLDESTCTLVLSVRDTGIGISAKDQTHLFNKFTQADSSTTRKFGGTGLGLAICRLLAELMEGRIELESVLNEGSTFTVTLPMHVADAETVKRLEQPQTAQMHLPIPQNARVLVAEDNEINQEIIAALLEKKKISFAIAASGTEVLIAIGKEVFDLILMDIQMPEMDGLTTTRVLRRQGYTLPILAMTANAMDTDREKSKEAGMDAHIPKPIDPDTLYRELGIWLNKSRGGISVAEKNEPAAPPLTPRA